LEKLKEAEFYTALGEGKVKCILCPHNCAIKEGSQGICGVRGNRGGKLVTYNYGKISGIALDRIEKKPLYHFYPGSHILSVGTYGCNFSCTFCQNWEIAKTTPACSDLSPQDLVMKALEIQDNIGIAYTYNEPTIWYEFVLESSKIAKLKGLKNVLITNGYIESEPLAKLIPFIDAVNIDLKGSSPRFYKELCGGTSQQVLETIITADRSCHVEITNLLIPDSNDYNRDIEELCKMIFNINANIPLHFSRYYPAYKLHKDPTPEETMYRAKEIGSRWLKYVYLGNLWESDNNTYCPMCRNLLVERYGIIMPWGIEKGKCLKCGYDIYGKFI